MGLCAPWFSTPRMVSEKRVGGGGEGRYGVVRTAVLRAKAGAWIARGCT